MKTIPLQYAGTSGNQISCAKISRETREPHASPRHEMAGSLAKFTGIAIAKGSFMKTIYSCLAIFILSLINSSAMEGLKVAVISTNAVLTWPSTNDGETYLVQYRSNLTSTAWTTIADYLPASGSNSVTFVDVTNTVTFGDAGTNSGGDGGTPPNPNPGDTNSLGSGSNDSFVSYTGFYQVVRDGCYMYIENTNWSGTEEIPIELGNAWGTVPSIELDENENPQGNSVEPPGTMLTVDTTQMTNGVNEVYLNAEWDGTGTNGQQTEIDSPPVAVNIYNEISFPDWMPAYGELGNSCVFNFTCGHTNETWELDVYGSDYAYIGSFNGDTTTNGTISVGWDLVDGNGVTHTNDTFFIGVVTTGYESGGNGEIHPDGEFQAQAVTPPTYKVNDPWLGPGEFAIALQHAFDNLVDNDLLYDELSGFTGAANGSYGVLPAQSGSTPFAISFQDNNEANGWSAFRSAIYNPYVRNLCYFGHGGKKGLGYDDNNTNVSIPATEIGAVLNNIPAGQTNAHRFRFVFVDGCSTAKGLMPSAFGIIDRQNVPLIDYYNASLRPSCYCGWPDNKDIDYVNGSALNYGHVSFITDIQTFMLSQGQTIQQAVNSAANDPAVNDTFTTTGDFKIFGCPDVTFGSNNN